MTIDELKRSGWIIMEAIVGSQSFGLATDKSDVDVRGVFVLPMEDRLSSHAVDQVADEKNNNVYWELAKFLNLLREANPSALELLNSPASCITVGKDVFDSIPKVVWLTPRCRDSFVKYARAQLNRAYGLNKKVFKPYPKEPPRVLDYCYVVDGNMAVPFREYLGQDNQKWYALAAIDHITDTYALYRQDPVEGWVPSGNGPVEKPEHEWRWAYGVVSDDETACDIQLNSIPKGISPIGVLFFNKNAYSHDCAEHTKYWRWVAERNEERYAGTIAHGKGYDAKNVMHCVRLLMTAKDIAEKGVVTVDRTADREYLFRIKRGEFSYDEVVALGNRMCEEVEELFQKSDKIHEPMSQEDFDRMFTRMLLSLDDKYSRLIPTDFELDEDFCAEH